MTVRFRLIALFAFIVCLAFLTAHATPPAGYYEVWGDEFSGTSLDPTKWWVWNQPDRSGYSTPSAVEVTNGCMVIQVYSVAGENYSGIVSSDARFRPRYGYMESSVEFNGSPGMFSDFWINSVNNGAFIGDPAAEGAEVDVCEHRVTDASNADNISGQVTIDLHWNGYGSSESSFNSPFYGSGLGTGFHTYGLLWSPTNYNVSIDGVSTMETNEGVSQRTEIVLFSCEIDSNSFCGIVPTGGYGDQQTSTTSTMVDYYRFYAPTTTLYWLGGDSANWSDTNNWLSNMVPASGIDAVFSYLSVGNFSVNLDQNVTVNSLSLEETPGITISGNPLTINGGGIDMLSALNGATINCPVVLGAAQTWATGSGIPLIVNGPVSGSGNLTISQLGAVALQAPDTSTGTTTVSGGTLYVNNTMSGPVTVAGGTLSGTGALSGTITVNSGILSGTETLTAPVVVNKNGTLEPGSPTGTLIISNTLTLQPGSSTIINIDKSAGTHGQVTGLSSVTLGGTLVVSNLSAALAPGDSFIFMNAGAYSGEFTRISPATPGPGLVWDSSALNTGILRVVSLSPGFMNASLAGPSQVSLSWSANNAGWLLQAQTNPPGMGITTNWITIPGSNLTNFMNLTVNSSVGSVFFRLVTPSYSTSVFGHGDLVVLQVGNGSISSSGAPGALEDFSPIGGTSQLQISLPTSGSSALIFGGSSYDGDITFSADGQNIVVPGYNIGTGEFSGTIDSSSTTGSPAVRRGIGMVNLNGTYALGVSTTKFSGSTIRAAIADGAGNFWAGGGNSGIVYLGTNQPVATLSTVSTATRDMGFGNGNICFSEDSSGVGVMAFNGTPTGSSTPSLIINNSGHGTGSPKGFVIGPTNIAYYADNGTASSGGGVERFNWNGSSWVYAYTLGNNTTSSKEVEDIAVDFTGPNPIIYATTGESSGNHLVKCTDTGSGSTFSSIETAPSGDAFRGVVLIP